MSKEKNIPIWKRSCIDKLDTYSIRQQLYDMAEIEYTYSDSARSEEFHMFFQDISCRAQNLLDLLGDYCFDENEICKGWDDFTVVLLGGAYRVLGFDVEEQDYFSLFERGFGNYGEELAIREATERLMRLSKQELLDRWRKVLVILTAYIDLKAAYDGLTGALDFLENDGLKKSEELTADIERTYARLWYSDGYTIDRKYLPAFEAALEKTYPEMWIL
jgi:hypothetical protein